MNLSKLICYFLVALQIALFLFYTLVTELIIANASSNTNSACIAFVEDKHSVLHRIDGVTSVDEKQILIDNLRLFW